MGVEVSILTAMPNYPEMKVHVGYRGKFYHHEVIGGIHVHRSWIYAGTSKAILSRLINYFSFVKSSFLVGAFKIGKQDIIFCESPPLFLGMTAWLLSKIKGARLIFNVSDLWPESAEKLGLVKNKFLLGLSTKLEEFLYRHSLLVTGQTQGIVRNISMRFPAKTIHWLKNGVDLNELEAIPENNDWRVAAGFLPGDFLLLYAGIIGHAQGLEVILQAAAMLRERPEVKFLLVGSGPVRDELIRMKQEMKLDNVFFYDNRPKAEVIPIVRSANVAIIPLRKLDLFKGAIPSKIFENLALKKPILLGVEGEAKELFIDDGKAGWAFEPGNATDLAIRIRYILNNMELLAEAGDSGFNYLHRVFDLDQIAREFLDLVTRKHLAS
jgi:glycosyltransferase involved in cell wall biosynthesis